MLKIKKRDTTPSTGAKQHPFLTKKGSHKVVPSQQNFMTNNAQALAMGNQANIQQLNKQANSKKFIILRHKGSNSSSPA